MRNEYKTIYIVSFVGEYELKHSREIVRIDSLEDFDKELAKSVKKSIQNKLKVTMSNDYFSNLSYLAGTDEELHQKALDNSKYLFELLNQPYGVGADDGHYDYFPDLVEQFKQLCEQIGAVDLYNSTIKLLRQHEEYKECEEVEFDLI